MGTRVFERVTGLALGVLVMGCGGEASRLDTAGGPELDADDWRSEWRQLALPGDASEGYSITGSPGGWLLISSVAGEDYAYRSSDGVRWVRVRLPESSVRLTGVAYGAGRYVIVGHTADAGHLIWVSTDGDTWHEPPVAEGFGLDGVQFVAGRFFGWGIDIWSSEDAESWAQTRRDEMYFPVGVAFGAGRYLLVGLGVPQLSFDGLSWRSAPIDCSLDSACVIDVEGSNPYHQFRSVLFAEGRFYVARLRSADGQSWEEIGRPGPTSYLSGRFLRRQPAIAPDPGTLEVWSEGGAREPIDVRAAPEVQLPSEGDIPERLDYSSGDGLDCASARCVLLGRDLYLIP